MATTIQRHHIVMPRLSAERAVPDDAFATAVMIVLLAITTVAVLGYLTWTYQSASPSPMWFSQPLLWDFA